MADQTPAPAVGKAAEVPAAALQGARKRDQTPPVRARCQASEDAGKAAQGSAAVSKGTPADEAKEFGGPVGAFFIIVFSHILMFLMASSLYGTDWKVFVPTPKSVAWFLAYHGLQYTFARFMPGVWVKGISELGYLCNGYSTFYASLACALVFHLGGVFDLVDLATDYPAFLSTAVILGDVYSVIVHARYAERHQRWSVYDFFIGVETHPRIGSVDIKMVAETRLSWTLLFLVTLGSFIQASRRFDSWMNPAAFMVLAHGLYANACAKGEHFIPYTWDISTEKFGWMLCWWNLAGVPLLYCYQSLFLAKYSLADLTLPPLPEVYYGLLVVALLLAYWIWDEANYHKCYFKMEQRGEILNRKLFPTFRHVKDPKYIKCDAGVLLIDGWYAYARKIHYTADTAMALLWGLACGFSSALPYFYFCFFVGMITHRAGRDEARCREKYGATWDKYLKAVPYRFVPKVY